jgi:hypothetical protein
MSLKSKKTVLLDLGVELSRIEMKGIVGGTTQTVCTGGTYNIGCSPGYCAGAGHGSFVQCTDSPSGNNTQCTDGTYAIGCSPGYCTGAGHGSFVSCY